MICIKCGHKIGLEDKKCSYCKHEIPPLEVCNGYTGIIKMQSVNTGTVLNADIDHNKDNNQKNDSKKTVVIIAMTGVLAMCLLIFAIKIHDSNKPKANPDLSTEFNQTTGGPFVNTEGDATDTDTEVNTEGNATAGDTESNTEGDATAGDTGVNTEGNTSADDTGILTK